MLIPVRSPVMICVPLLKTEMLETNEWTGKTIIKSECTAHSKAPGFTKEWQTSHVMVARTPAAESVDYNCY